MPRDPLSGIPEFEEDKSFLVSGKVLNEIKRVLRANRPLTDDTLTSKETPDGIMLGVKPGGEDFNWKAQAAAGGATLSPGIVHGDYGDVFPTINGVVMSEGPVLAIGAEVTGYIYLDLTVTLQDTDGYVEGGHPTAAEVKFGAVVPADNGTNHFYLALASVSPGVRIAQIRRYNIQVKFCDDGTATGLGVMTVGVSP